jgi:Tol biopolymer transport system component
MARSPVISLCGSLALSLAAGLASAADTDRLGLFLVEIDSGKITQVASEPVPGHGYCGSPDWSADGKRILLDATPGRQWSKTHIVASEFPRNEQSKFVDLGPGNCPTWSPDGKQVVFRVNPGAPSAEQAGIWIMNADGTGRKRLADGNLPKWSPDGKRILSATFDNPSQLFLIDAVSGAEQAVELTGYEFFSVPSWAGDGQTIVAVVRTGGTLAIALVDVADPASAKIKEVIWTRGTGVSDEPIYPVYSAAQKRCVFAGRSAAGFVLYLALGKPGALPKRLEPNFNDKRIAGMAMSPDGKRVLFGSERKPDQAQQ